MKTTFLFSFSISLSLSSLSTACVAAHVAELGVELPEGLGLQRHGRHQVRRVLLNIP